MSAKPLQVNYCPEAIDHYLSKFPEESLNIMIHNIADFVSGKINDLEILWDKPNVTGSIVKVKVPIDSLLKSNTVKTALISLGINEEEISNCIDQKPKLTYAMTCSLRNERCIQSILAIPNDIDRINKFIEMMKGTVSFDYTIELLTNFITKDLKSFDISVSDNCGAPDYGVMHIFKNKHIKSALLKSHNKDIQTFYKILELGK